MSLKYILAALVVAGGAGAAIYFYLLPKPDTGGNTPEISASRPREAVPVPKVTFTDVTKEAGITFRHTNGATEQKFLPETMGAGVAVLDYDRDGLQDILFVNSRPWPGAPAGDAPTQALYRNLGGWKFADVTKDVGLAVSLFGMGAAVGDFDNDSWPDLYLTAVGGCRLFRNDKGKFVDVTTSSGAGGPQLWPGVTRDEFMKVETPIPFPSSAAFFDYDNDGRLDLFVCHYVTWSPQINQAIDAKLVGVGRAYVPPTQFEGAQCVLYKNIDGSKFKDVSAEAGVQVFAKEGTGPNARQRNVGKSLGVVACDPDGDGWMDVIVANDTVRNFHFHNVAGPNGRTFEEKGEFTRVAYAEGRARGGMGIDWGEFHGGKCALIIANFANEPSTFLCLDNPKKLLFSEAALSVGISGESRGPLKFGAFFFDYDLDGRLDLLTANGHLEPEITKVQQSQTYAQSAQLFWNTGTSPRVFEPATAADAGKDIFTPIVGRGAAYGDFDNDGDLDVVLTANGGTPLLLRNDLKSAHWVRVRVEGDGKLVSRDAIGTEVTVTSKGVPLKRVVTGARGYLSQPERELTFGIASDVIDSIEWKWPGGTLPPGKMTDVKPGAVVVIKP